MCIPSNRSTKEEKEYNVQNQSKHLLPTKKRPPLLVVENDIHIIILVLSLLLRRKGRGWLLHFHLHIIPSPPDLIQDLSTSALSTGPDRLFLESKRKWEGEWPLLESLQALPL